ncbi:MAG: secretin N-terminal domain-containing protein [Candidatus Omnitrophota bacterium]
MQKYKWIIAYILIILFMNSLSFSQTVTPLKDDLDEDVSLPAVSANKISLDFKDANIIDVLRLLSQEAGISFVPTKDVEDKEVTLIMENVTVEEAIAALMSANDLIFEKTKGNINIIRKSGAPEIKTETKIYTLNYVRIGEAASGSKDKRVGDEKGGIFEIMKKILTSYGSVVADARTNSIIITDISTRFELIEEVLARLDTPTPQVVIEVEVIETTAGLVDDLGFKWGGVTGTILSATPAIRPSPFPFKKVGVPTSYGVEYKENTFTFGTLSASAFETTLNMIRQDTSTRFLARPKIMVLNNESAEIKIVADQAIGREITTDPDSNLVTITYERAEIGTTLKVTPLVNNINMITLKIEPEVSRAVDSPVFSEVIDKHSRKADTVVMLKDGETVVLGGFITTEDSGAERNLPGLSSLPFIGALFKHNRKSRTDKELLVFLTPHVVKQLETVVLPVEQREEIAEQPQREEVTKKTSKEIKVIKESERIEGQSASKPKALQPSAKPIALQPQEKFSSKKDTPKVENTFIREQ